MLSLGDVFENVMDHGATGDGHTNDLVAIQTAINRGRPLLFPAGTYLLQATEIWRFLDFRTAGQRALFLPGSSLKAEAPDVWIRISAPDQVFRGMTLDPNVLPVTSDTWTAHDPILEITGADNLVMEDFYTHSGADTTQVRVSNTQGITFRNSWIHGSWSKDAPSAVIGLDIAENVSGLRFLHSAITEQNVALIISAETSDLTFIYSTFESGGEIAVSLRSGRVDGLLMQACHFEGKLSRLVHVEVQESATLSGALFAGCSLGELKNPVDDAEVRRVFRIAGTIEGMVVKGGSHVATDRVNDYVWEFVPGCRVRNCEDRFNFWDHVTVVAGTDLRTQWSTEDSTLTLQAPSVRFTAGKVGFFGATPVARQRYVVPASVNRTLAHGKELQVLATLIRDLGLLGILEV